LIEAVPPIRGKRGQPRRRPQHLYTDRGFDHEAYRDPVRAAQIIPHIARRGTEHGSGLGSTPGSRQERSLCCAGFAACASAGEIRDDIHLAFRHPRLRHHLLATPARIRQLGGGMNTLLHSV
jgi:hypothetical protein